MKGGLMHFVREPAVSGMFYPDDPTKLRKDIETYLKCAVVPDLEENVIGIISPHAGYMYSGKVAAYGFRMIVKKQYDTVILIGPSHRAYFEGVALWDRGSFETPLGRTDIDEDIAGEIVNINGIIKPNMDTHREEHSLEVQLPFLQSVLDSFKIIPLVMGIQTSSACRELAQSLSEVIQASKKKFLVVGSTDLSHYYPYAVAKKLDDVIVGRLGTFNIPGMIEDIETGKTEACGAGPIIATMMLSEKLGADHGTVLKYANSGDVSGDKAGVVGYVSAVFCRKQQSERGMP
jgi:AmmeMemoRadiSam system protein B